MNLGREARERCSPLSCSICDATVVVTSLSTMLTITQIRAVGDTAINHLDWVLTLLCFWISIRTCLAMNLPNFLLLRLGLTEEKVETPLAQPTLFFLFWNANAERTCIQRACVVVSIQLLIGELVVGVYHSRSLHKITRTVFVKSILCLHPSGVPPESDTDWNSKRPPTLGPPSLPRRRKPPPPPTFAPQKRPSR
jgi:hypothetical protein